MTPMSQVPPERREIRMFPDYGRRYPLWENSTPTWDVGYTTSPETYCLSPELAEDLEGWQSFFEAHAHPAGGWDSHADLLKWLRDGEWLAKRLQEEVRSFADVKREFGPQSER